MILYLKKNENIFKSNKRFNEYVLRAKKDDPLLEAFTVAWNDVHKEIFTVAWDDVRKEIFNVFDPDEALVKWSEGGQ